MKMPICPSCQEIKLIRSRAFSSVNDPNSGKEYLVCPRCCAKWFMDDPNRPVAVHDKPKESIWKTLATWGAPHNEPDAFGVLHPLTYVFPPRHDYPSCFLPPASAPLQPVPIPTKSPESKSFKQPEACTPTGVQSELPVAPAPEPGLLSTTSPHEPPTEPFHLTETDSALEQKDQKESESHPDPGTPAHIHQIPPQEPLLSLSASNLEGLPQPAELVSTPTPFSNLCNEEQARYDLLSRIVNSPLPPILHYQHDMYELSDRRSIFTDEYEPSIGSQAGSDQQHLLQTLIRIAATPGSPPHMIDPCRTLSPKVALPELATDAFREEHDTAAHARRIAKRIEHAIQSSPFLPPRGLQSPCSEKWIDSPKLTLPNSPASKHSTRHSIAHSAPPRSHCTKQHDDDTISMTGSPYEEDPLPLPGGFPTPKPTPLTTEALGSMTRQTSRSSGTVRSSTISTSLPAAPYIARPSKRGSVTSAGRSPLFS